MAYLRLNLVMTGKDMAIILHEATDAGQTREGSRNLITMEDTLLVR
mgnify:CR=1 FL=1